MDDLELDPVGVVEERRVVPGGVRPFLRLVLDLEALGEGPPVALVDELARGGLEREVVEPDRVPVVLSGRLRFPQAERDADSVAVEIPDRLSALAAKLGRVHVPERLEQLAVERQAALEPGDDDVDVVHPDPRHRASVDRAGRL